MSQTMHVRVDSEWSNVEKVREMTLDFLRSLALAHDVVDAGAMVASELTENAAKYGAFADEDDGIDVTVSGDWAMWTVEVKNPIMAEHSKKLSGLDAMIQRIRGHQDPFEAYLERLREVSSKSLDDGESGLGLVRIAYEGHAVLDFFVDEHDVLTVSASYRE
jgi:hypothetical protein